MQPAAALKYGLNKPGAAAPRRAALFNDDEGDVEDDFRAKVARAAQRAASGGPAAAPAPPPPEEDYDGWKDAEEEARRLAKASASGGGGGGGAAPPPKDARYIAALLDKAKERALEKERMLDRKFAREQEAEAGLYGESTESFVTGAYAARLAERAAAEAEGAKREAQDAVNDVTKKGDLSGFYRSVLRGDMVVPRPLALALTTSRPLSVGSGKAPPPGGTTSILDDPQGLAEGVKARVKDVAGRVADAGRVAKQHVKAAAGNQAQAAADVVVGGAEATDVLSAHGKEAKRDMRTWKEETKSALAGEAPEDVRVRDVPPMEQGQEGVQDVVKGVKIKPSSSKASPRPPTSEP